MSTKYTILSVDDSPDDAFLLQRACRKAGVQFNLVHVEDGRYAMDYLAGVGSYSNREEFPLPAMILLDLKMPRATGFEVLEWMAGQPSLLEFPVAILTSSQNEEDIRQTYQKGARWYIVKPVEHHVLTHLMKLIQGWLDSPQADPLISSPQYRPPL
jgi:CheY-like chemotaxis protein